MDKSTLSNYGWVVIVTLVLAVMLALATPFGDYVAKGASNVIKTFANTSNDAIDEDNIDVQSDNWDSYLNDNEYNHLLGVHEGGTYTTVGGETVTSATGDGIVNFPSREPQVGDIYVYGDYEYKYGYELSSASTWKTEATSDFNGWGVKRLDTTKSHYAAVLHSINGKPLLSMKSLFAGGGMNSAFKTVSDDFCIPETVINIERLFLNQQNFEKLPSTFKIPDSVRYMESAFTACKSLKEIPGFQIPYGVTSISHICNASNNLTFNEPIVIPDTVTEMQTAFYFTNINANVYIPESVDNINEAFATVTFGQNVVVTINCNPSRYSLVFKDIKSPVKITGSCIHMENIKKVGLQATPNGSVTTFYDQGYVTIV